jgi:hypothetical protein
MVWFGLGNVIGYPTHFYPLPNKSLFFFRNPKMSSEKEVLLSAVEESDATDCESGALGSAHYSKQFLKASKGKKRGVKIFFILYASTAL